MNPRGLLRCGSILSKQARRIRGAPNSLRSSRSVTTVVLLRHGESTWNGDDARFTGWADVPLTVGGRVEAVQAGALLRLRGLPASRIDAAFASDLERSHETCELALAAAAGPEKNTWCTQRIRRDKRLNERHYGVLQGEHKTDPALSLRYGADNMLAWRRGMFDAPPPMEAHHPHFSPSAPTTESLADCQARVAECYRDSIAPAMFDEGEPDGRVILVVSHSNALRALMAYFDNVPEEDVPNIYVPNSVPILYRFDRKKRQPVSKRLATQSGSSHARWLLSPENLGRVRDAVQPGGTLSRAMFDTIACTKENDRGDDIHLAANELEEGLAHLLKDDGDNLDCAVRAVAKELVRENWYLERECGTITRQMFEERAERIWSELYISAEKDVCAAGGN